MRRFAVLSLALFALLVLPLTAAADTKWVRGTLTAVGGDSVTVKVMGNGHDLQGGRLHRRHRQGRKFV